MQAATLSAPRPALTDRPPSLEALQSLVRADLSEVDALILRRVENEIGLITQLARHLIASGGKRIRPALTLASARLCGYMGKHHVTLAAAIEFIHTATLLHDDVVDESKLRRGLASANELWGNKASVLVGDFLLSQAFQLMVLTGSIRVLEILSDTSAVIASGEVKQLLTTNAPETTREMYLDVVACKTAVLFASACQLGGVISGRSDREVTLRDYGMNLGIAFQLVDDALDYAAAQEKLGKTIGDDFREGKITMPVLVAYAKSNKQEKAFWDRTLQEHQQQEGDLKTALSIIEKHDGIRETLKAAAGYTALACKALEVFEDSPEKQALLEAADFCVRRAY